MKLRRNECLKNNGSGVCLAELLTFSGLMQECCRRDSPAITMVTTQDRKSHFAPAQDHVSHFVHTPYIDLIMVCFPCSHFAGGAHVIRSKPISGPPAFHVRGSCAEHAQPTCKEHQEQAQATGSPSTVRRQPQE